MKNEKAALLGGTPAVTEGAFGSLPEVGTREKQMMVEYMERPDFGVVAQASPDLPSKLLSERWARYLGVKYCLAVNSGTAALHMCIAALGIGPGDEVILPALTFWASAAAVLHHNAIPVFVDIDPVTYCMDPARLEEKITEHTKAIMPVHLHGMPADMDAITAIARKHGIKVISDAAQAPGAVYKGRKIGTMADVTGFSMEVSKPFSSGSEGGLFVTDNVEYYERAALLRQFGELVVPGQQRKYNAFGIGWNYRMSEFGAVFGLSQLEKFDATTARRRESCAILNRGLADIAGVNPPAVPEGCEPVYFNYVLEFSPAAAGVDMDPAYFMECTGRALAAEGIPIGKWQHVPVPAQAVFSKMDAYGKGCPWNCSHYRGKVAYKAEDYPETMHFLKTHTYLGPFVGKLVPHDPVLAGRIVDGFRKVFGNLPEVLEMVQAENKNIASV